MLAALNKLNAFLHFDKEHGGEAASTWQTMLGMAFPETMFGKPLTLQLTQLLSLALSNMETCATQMLDMVEYCAGYGNLSRAFLRRKWRVAPLDQKFSPLHDALTSAGLRLWVLCLCFTSGTGMLWFAPECSSFVALSASQHCRKESNDFMGDCSKDFVNRGNSLMIICSMIMCIGLSLGLKVGLEQPNSSAMMSTKWMSHVITFFQMRQQLTYLGAFGAATCKPLILTSSFDLSGMARSRPVMEEQLTVRDEDNCFTGKKCLLEDSERYTVSFAEALADITVQ